MRNSPEVLRRRTAKAEAEVERIRAESEVPLPAISSYFPKFWARAGDGMYRFTSVCIVSLPFTCQKMVDKHKKDMLEAEMQNQLL